MNYFKFYNVSVAGPRKFNAGGIFNSTVEAAAYRNLYPLYAGLSDEQVLNMKRMNEEADAAEETTPEEIATLDQRALLRYEQLLQDEGISPEEVLRRKQELIDRGVIQQGGGTNNPLTDSELPVGTPATKNFALANYATAAAGSLAGVMGGTSAAESVNMVSTIALNPELAGTGIGKAGMGLGVISAAANMIDKSLMGDKNFGAQSEAIDSVVHGASSALMKSGNPYAMAAGAALEGANFLTKAGGQTVEGFDVDIKSSGYGTMGHKDSSSSRDFGAMIGLGGLNVGATERKLKQRNELAQMALKASNVADNIAFEQEARMNSVDDVIQQNEIALLGGLDTSLLVAKHGAKLLQTQHVDKKQLEKVIIDTPEKVIIDSTIDVPIARNGAKLEHIETSQEQNVIPSGAMHKNKNHLDLDVTKKGIPVITVEDDSVETFSEIKELEDTLVQHAEVEEAEIIFNKELTIFIENMRKLWHEKDKKDDNICLEAGLRITKEILENTEDNTDVTEKSILAVENENN